VFVCSLDVADPVVTERFPRQPFQIARVILFGPCDVPGTGRVKGLPSACPSPFEKYWKNF